jgi:hypothetical protein
MAAKGHVSRDVYLVSGQTASHFTDEEYRLPAFLRILMIAIFTARIEGAHSDRAASASKKEVLAAPNPTLPRQRVQRYK